MHSAGLRNAFGLAPAYRAIVVGASLCLATTVLAESSEAKDPVAPVGPESPVVPEVKNDKKATIATTEKSVSAPGGNSAKPISVDAPLPPSLTAEALRDELRRASRAGQGAAFRIEEERARLKTERSELQQMASDIGKARQELREETNRLVAAAQKPTKTPAEAAGKNVPTPVPGTSAKDAGKKRDGMKDLAKTLQGMKPDQAAALLERLSPDLSTQLFRRMKPDEAAPITEKLRPDVAARLFAAVAAASRREESK